MFQFFSAQTGTVSRSGFSERKIIEQLGTIDSGMNFSVGGAFDHLPPSDRGKRSPMRDGASTTSHAFAQSTDPA